jgi:gas vesicle protein
MYREEQPGASFMLGIMTGALIGAGVALLFAPKAGTEMRQQLGEQYRGLADRVGESTQHLRESARQLRDQGRERVEQLTGHLSDRATTAADRAATAAERFSSSAPSV